MVKGQLVTPTTRFYRSNAWLERLGAVDFSFLPNVPMRILTVAGLNSHRITSILTGMEAGPSALSALGDGSCARREPGFF